MIQVAALQIPSALDQETFNNLMMLVSEEKRTRILRFRFAADALRTLLAEVLLRLELCERLRVPNSALGFITNPYGKPYLDRLSGCSFNLAHSGSWVSVAIGPEPIG
ncbi:MAG: 4-phosphopantetheinyl transferase, partial [Paenibacillaceae bacterium]|nr:4-phosphopantetheinyl transferase [Paenibacillaceae bacterium]